uniref:Fibronectin type-III domain-containing protein n=1 Tax=Heterorhabditis bacteriophora TaxID=37862 RepID=A0A1I7X1U3_HETBA
MTNSCPTPTVEWNDNKGELIKNSEKFKVEISGLNTILTISGVEVSDRGEYTLRVKNHCGEDSYPIAIQITDRPGAPGRPSVQDQNLDSVRLLWSAPTQDGGSPVRNYTVEMCTAKNKTWSKAEVTPQLFVTLFNLIAKETYRFRIKANNAFGQSDASEESEPVFVKYIIQFFLNLFLNKVESSKYMKINTTLMQKLIIKDLSRIVEEPVKKKKEEKEPGVVVDYEKLDTKVKPEEYKTIDIHRLPNDLQTKVNYVIFNSFQKFFIKCDIKSLCKDIMNKNKKIIFSILYRLLS